MSVVEHHSRRIASGIFWVIAFVCLAKVVGAAKEIVLASRYGVSDLMDAFVIISTLVAFPVGIWFGAVQAVAVPADLRAAAIGQQAVRDFRGECLGLTLLLGIAFAVLMTAGAPYLIRFAAGSDASIRLAVDIVPLMGWLVLPGMVGALAAGWIMATGRYIGSLLEAIPAFLLVIIVLAASESSIDVLVAGAIAGALMHAIVAMFCSVKGGGVWLPRFSLRSQQWHNLKAAAVLVFLGQGVFSAATLVEQFILARLGEGGVATFSFAARLIALLVGIGALAVNRATLPVFSELFALGRDAEARVIAQRWLARLFLVGGITVPVVWFLAPYAVSILFEHGKFTGDDTHAVAVALQWMAPQLPFYFAGLVLAALAAACGEYFALFLSGVIGLGVRSIAAWLGADLGGVNGVALAAAVTYGVNCLYLGWVLFRDSTHMKTL